MSGEGSDGPKAIGSGIITRSISFDVKIECQTSLLARAAALIVAPLGQSITVQSCAGVSANSRGCFSTGLDCPSAGSAHPASMGEGEICCGRGDWRALQVTSAWSLSRGCVVGVC